MYNTSSRYFQHLVFALLALFHSSFAFTQEVQYNLQRWELSLDSRGRLIHMLDKTSGLDYGYPETASALIALKIDTTVLLPTRAVFSENNQRIALQFENGITVEVKALPKNKYITFEVLSVSDDERIDVLIWGPYATTINQSIGETIGIVQTDSFTIGLQALNVKTLGGYPWKDNDHLPQLDIFEQADPGDVSEGKRWVLYSVEAAKPTAFGSSLQAYTRNRKKDRVIANWGHERYRAPAYDDGGPVGSKIALFGCETKATLSTIGEIELAEGLPHPELNGVWVKTSPVINSSYLIMDFTEANIDQCLDYCAKSGFRYLYHGHPFASWGHFPLIKEQFPNGRAGMKHCVQKAEARGIYVGTHTLTNFINTNDSYVTPVPDKRLAKVGGSALVQDIDAVQQEIEVESPGFFNQFQNNNLRAVVIGAEIIRYGAVSETAPWLLTDCQRGAFGTSASAHKKGTAAEKLADHGYKVFLGNAALNKEMAENIAGFMNETGVRMLDFDGLEGAHSTGMGNYGEALFARQWYDHLNDNIRNHFLLGASRSGHYFWHIYSRMNWGEPWYAGFRESQTEYRLLNQNYFRRNLMPGMLGWFKMTPSTTVEDIQWLMTRSAAYDAGFAFVTNLETLEKNGMTDKLFSIMNTWETARLNGVFSEEIKQRMRDLSTEFKLEKTTENKLVLTEVFSHKFNHEPQNRQPGEPLYSRLDFENKIQEQVLSFIITSVNADISTIQLEINNYKTISFPIELKRGQSLKYTGGERAILYNENWNRISTIPIDASLLKLSMGKQTVNFDCVFQNAGENAVVKVELIVQGLPEEIGN